MKQLRFLLRDGALSPTTTNDFLRGLGIQDIGRAIQLLLDHQSIRDAIPRNRNSLYFLLNGSQNEACPENGRFGMVSRMADVLQLEFPYAAEKLRAQLATLVLERL